MGKDEASLFRKVSIIDFLPETVLEILFKNLRADFFLFLFLNFFLFNLHYIMANSVGINHSEVQRY